MEKVFNRKKDLYWECEDKCMIYWHSSLIFQISQIMPNLKLDLSNLCYEIAKFLPVNTSCLMFFSQWPCWSHFCLELRVFFVLNASTRYEFVHHAAILVGSPYATHPSCLKLKCFETRQSSNSGSSYRSIHIVLQQTVMNAREKYFHNQSQFWIWK